MWFFSGEILTVMEGDFSLFSAELCKAICLDVLYSVLRNKFLLYNKGADSNKRLCCIVIDHFQG